MSTASVESWRCGSARALQPSRAAWAPYAPRAGRLAFLVIGAGRLLFLRGVVVRASGARCGGTLTLISSKRSRGHVGGRLVPARKIGDLA
jgi:hypothetical protein